MSFFYISNWVMYVLSYMISVSCLTSDITHFSSWCHLPYVSILCSYLTKQWQKVEASVRCQNGIHCAISKSLFHNSTKLTSVFNVYTWHKFDSISSISVRYYCHVWFSMSWNMNPVCSLVDVLFWYFRPDNAVVSITQYHWKSKQY
jgi:hypothetical protein